jgi:hypothetical protein
MLRHFIVRAIASSAIVGLAAGVPTLAQATATAQGVALNVNAGCTAADLDLTLTTAGASREFGQATNLSGATLNSFEGGTTLQNFSGTFTGFGIGPLLPPQPAGTLIGSYAYVGTTPPAAATTAEFFIFYNCSTRQVLLTCFGPYGTCPQTAQQVLTANSVPTLDPAAVAALAVLLALSAFLALRRRA